MVLSRAKRRINIQLYFSLARSVRLADIRLFYVPESVYLFVCLFVMCQVTSLIIAINTVKVTGSLEAQLICQGMSS